MLPTLQFNSPSSFSSYSSHSLRLFIILLFLSSYTFSSLSPSSSFCSPFMPFFYSSLPSSSLIYFAPNLFFFLLFLPVFLPLFFLFLLFSLSSSFYSSSPLCSSFSSSSSCCSSHTPSPSLLPPLTLLTSQRRSKLGASQTAAGLPGPT